MLASFRPTWGQAFARGLAVGALLVATGMLAAGPLVLLSGRLSGNGDGPGARSGPGATALLALAVPPGLGLLVAVTTRRWATARLDSAGVRTGGLFRSAAFVPWDRVVDIRAERRHRRTVVAVYRTDGVVRRLRAPYDGQLLGHDARFERKLFLIQHLWETHRSWSIPGRAPPGPSVA